MDSPATGNRKWLALLFLLNLAPVHAGGREKGLEHYHKLVTPQVRKRLETLAPALAAWPASAARRAVEEILEIGDAAVPFLSLELRTGKPRARLAAAAAAAELGRRVLFDAVAAAARDETETAHLKLYFDTLARLDERRAVAILLGFLKSSRLLVRFTAYRHAFGRTRPADVPDLVSLLAAPKAQTRMYAAMLLGRHEDRRALKPLVALLADRDPQPADAASRTLAGYRDPDLPPMLLAGAEDLRVRLRCYSLLTLVRAEAALGVRLVADRFAKQLLRDLNADHLFLRGVSALAVASLGAHSSKRAVIEAMDRSLVPILISILGGGVYFRDYSSIKEDCFAALRRLTGRNFFGSPDRWRRWWLASRRNFKAIRALDRLTEAYAARFEVSYRLREFGSHREHVVVAPAAASGLAKRYPQARAYRVPGGVLGRLARLIERMRFFRLANRHGVPHAAASRREAAVVVDNLSKRVVLFGPQPGILAPLEKEVFQIARANRWQDYWDRTAYPDREVWLKKFWGFFEVEKDELVRVRKLKGMIVNSFGFLDRTRQFEAARLLVELMKEDPFLNRFEVEILGHYARGRKRLDHISRLLLEAMALSRREGAVEAVLPLLKADGSPQVQQLLADLLAGAGARVCLGYIRHREARLRAAALGVLWRFDRKDIDAVLMRSLHDPAPAAAAAAAASLGRRKSRLAIPSLEKLLDRDSPLVRRAGLVALGRIGGRPVFPALVKGLADKEESVRAGALQGLGHSRDENAIGPLMMSFEKPRNPTLMQVAGRALARLGHPKVIPALQRLARKGTSEGLRSESLALLERIRGSGAAGFLASFLEDPSLEVRTRVALLLARHHQLAAMTVLMDSHDRGHRRLQVQIELERLTCVSYTGPRAAVQYRRWWSLYSQAGPRMWLCAALKKRAYPVARLLDWAMGSTRSRQGAGVLLLAVADRDWFVAHNATWALRQISTRRDLPLVGPTSTQENKEATYRAWKKWWTSG